MGSTAGMQTSVKTSCLLKVLVSSVIISSTRNVDGFVQVDCMER